MTNASTRSARARTARGAAALLLLAAAGLAACGGGGLDEQLATVHSWRETMALAATLRQRHAVSDRAAAQLREAAKQALADARRQLPRYAATAADSARARAGTDSLDAAIRALGAPDTTRSAGR